MDIQDRQDSEGDIQRIRELLGSGIFEPANIAHPLNRSAFIELMICLRDLLSKAETYAQRVSFTDDVITSEHVRDVTGAITAARDACCHIDSFKKRLDDRGNRVSYTVACGKCNVARVGDLEIRSEYDDDIAVFFGTNRLYFKRHIIRAFTEAQTLLAPYLLASQD